MIQYENRGEISIAHCKDKSYYLKRYDSEEDNKTAFLLSIESNNVYKSNSEIDFYYAYNFEKDIYFLNYLDTIRPSLFHLEQSLEGAKKLNINMVFEGDVNQNSIYIEDKYGSFIQLPLTF